MARRKQITSRSRTFPARSPGSPSARQGGMNVEAFTSSRAGSPARRQRQGGGRALREARYPCLESEVLFLDLDHRPGGARPRGARAVAAGVNIDYAYSGSGPAPGRAFIVMSVSDLGKAEKAVERRTFDLLPNPVVSSPPTLRR